MSLNLTFDNNPPVQNPVLNNNPPAALSMFAKWGETVSGVIEDIERKFAALKSNFDTGEPVKQKTLQLDREHYEAETICLTVDNKESYFYGAFLNPVYVKWKSNPNGAL